MRSVLAFILLGYCSVGAAQSLSPDVRNFVKVDAAVIALSHVRVIDGTTAAPREDQTIIISKGKIGSVADASTVTVSESVREHAGDTFTFDALPARELKGFGEPVALYRAARR